MDGVDEIVQEFLVESYENLDQLDRDLVALEQTPDSRDLLGSIFRTIHTIKGTSGFLAFANLESVTHVGENLLARLRDGKMSMTPTTTDVLLAMVDVVRELLAAIEGQGTALVVDHEDSGAVADLVARSRPSAAPTPPSGNGLPVGRGVRSPGELRRHPSSSRCQGRIVTASTWPVGP